MEYVFAVWTQILEQLQKANHVLFLSDFDGTLTPVIEQPESAILSGKTHALLEEMAILPNMTVGVISGRTLRDLKEIIDLEGIIYAGNHGFEMEGPDFSFVNPAASEIRPFFRIFRQIMDKALGTIKGVIVEDKGITMSVHYQQSEAASASDLKNLLERTVNGPESSGLIKITPGKNGFELRPAVNWDKGKAIRMLMKKYGKGGRKSGLLPIYMGDDVSDEEGFRVIEKYGSGITILIGEPNFESSAQYYLESTEEVNRFMGSLIELKYISPLKQTTINSQSGDDARIRTIGDCTTEP